MKHLAVVVVLWSLTSFLSAQAAASSPAGDPVRLQALVDRWAAAVRAADEAALRALYPANPGFQAANPRLKPAEALKYWQRLRPELVELRAEYVRSEKPPQAGLEQMRVLAEMKLRRDGQVRTWYTYLRQVWQVAGDEPHIAAEAQEGPHRLAPATHVNPRLYRAEADASAEIRDAQAVAQRESKHVLLIFGGNWCYDCHVLDRALHHPDIRPYVDPNFVVLHVDIGEADRNMDLAASYRIDPDKGVPAIAVVTGDGKLLYADSKSGFRRARALTPEDLIAFLEKWKPALSRR